MRFRRNSYMPAAETTTVATVEKRPYRTGLPEPVAKARVKEQRYRDKTTRRKALQVLGHKYAAEYHALYRSFKAQIAAERGPLPGDE